MRPFPSAVCFFFSAAISYPRHAAEAATPGNMPAVSGFSGHSSCGPSHPLEAHVTRCSTRQRRPAFTCLTAHLHAYMLVLLSKHGNPRVTSHSSLSIDRNRKRSRFMCSNMLQPRLVLVVHTETTCQGHPVMPSPSRANRRKHPWNWWEPTKPIPRLPRLAYVGPLVVVVDLLSIFSLVYRGPTKKPHCISEAAHRTSSDPGPTTSPLQMLPASIIQNREGKPSSMTQSQQCA